MKLSSIHEETLEGIGFRLAKNLGRKIAQAMGYKSFCAKKNQRLPKAKRGGLKDKTAVGSSPVIKNPRHRKFFGLNNPHTPY